MIHIYVTPQLSESNVDEEINELIMVDVNALPRNEAKPVRGSGPDPAKRIWHWKQILWLFPFPITGVSVLCANLPSYF